MNVSVHNYIKIYMYIFFVLKGLSDGGVLTVNPWKHFSPEKLFDVHNVHLYRKFDDDAR